MAPSPDPRLVTYWQLMVRHMPTTDLWGRALSVAATLEDGQIGPHGQGFVTFKLHVRPEMANSIESMHGGCVTTFCDNMSTYGMICDPRYWPEAGPGDEVDMGQVVAATRASVAEHGVSRNLNVTFLRPVAIGSDVLLHVRVKSNSKRYCLLSFEMTSVDGRIMVTGTHEKAKPTAKL